MAKVRWTKEAELWLRDIQEYIESDNPDAADKTIDGIYKRAEILNEFPRLGHKHEHKTKKNIRILLYGHYRITYVINKDDTIDIIGVFPGRLDIDRLLED